jgi:uncharacterized protein YigE (DUF2233 family)
MDSAPGQMRRRLASFAAALALAALLALATLSPVSEGAWAATGPAAPCQPTTFERLDYVVCKLDLRLHELRLFWRDASATPYGAFRRLPRHLGGSDLVFAMNAGMYRADLAPVGLYVEDGRELRPVNTRDGPGNFHMKPNGVFYILGGRAGVAATEAYLERRLSPDFATQSGPMLVIDGAIHPRFLPRSTSRKRRNGVGVIDGHTVVFAISEGRVTFHEFARLFRDGLGADNALYLDGTMSSLYAPALGRADAIRPMGPIVGAYARH